MGPAPRLRLRIQVAVLAGVMLLAGCGVPGAGGARSDGRLPPRCEAFRPRTQQRATPAPAKRDEPPTSLRALYGSAAPDAFFDLAAVDLGRTLRQLRSLKERDRFVMPSSDVEVVVHSDGDLLVHRAAVDEIMHAHLRHRDRHRDAAAAARMACYARTILQDKAFAGTVVNLYVPANPLLCLRDLRLVVRPAGGRWSEGCDWGGVTPPVAVEGWLGEVRLAEFHMIIAPGVADATTGRVAQLLRHESDHLWDWMMGQAFHFTANERRALGGDALVRHAYAAHQQRWPVPFGYPRRLR